MFCSNCGQELPAGSKFCPACGAAVEALDPETRTAAEALASRVEEAANTEAAGAEDAAPILEETPVPAQTPAEPITEMSPVPAQAPVAQSTPAIAGEAAPSVAQSAPILTGRKGARSAILLAALAVAALAAVFGLVRLLPAIFGGGQEACVYSTDDGELMFLKKPSAKAETRELSDEFSGSVYFSRDGKRIYFLEGDSGSSYADLYTIRTADAGKKNVSPEKISSSVSTDDITVLDDGGLLYLKGSSGDTDLFWYNGKESRRIVRDLDYYSLDDSQKYVYYSEWDDGVSVFRVEIRKSDSKETLLKNVDDVFNAYSDDVLVYGMSNDDGAYDLYWQKPGGDKQKIASDVSSVFNAQSSGGKPDVLYALNESRDISLYDFVTDRLADSDAAAVQPDTSNYQTYVQGYFYGYYTTDWDAYNRAMEQWYPVQQRNSIRETLKSESYYTDCYTLYRCTGENTKKIAEDVTHLLYDLGSDIYLYQKFDSEVEPVADVADLESAWDVYDRMDSDGGVWYQLVGGTETELPLDDAYAGLSDLFVLNGSEAVLEAYDEDSEYALLSYGVGKGALSYKTEITDEYQSLYFTQDAKGRDALYYYANVSRDGESGDLVCYENGNKTTLVKEAEAAFILDDGAIFAIDDYNYNSRRNRSEFSLYSVGKDGRKSAVADDVSFRWIIASNKVLYVSDGDLYVWNGKSSERIATDVVGVWASKRANLSYFWCN